jgi:DNA-binding transcriptional MerR regulator/effector-binding domain-containing protein
MGVEVSGIPLFTIGEFSRISGITVKALRFYHEQQLLIPTSIDPQSGYRYYHESLIERAHAIVYLRELELPIESIRQILADAQDDDAQLIASLQKHKKEIEQRIRALKKAVRSLDQFIQNERQVKTVSAQVSYDIQEKSVDPMLIAGIRAKGKYSDCGKRFGQICRSFGRLCSGPPMTLYYDCEYKENDADFEACVPVKQAKTVEGISVREIPGGRAVTLLHRGPYDQLHASYAKITAYVKQKGYAVAGPTREIYLKGPGMIFRGNPKKYLTEIQFPIA